MDQLLKRPDQDHADKHQEILDNIALLRNATSELANSIFELAPIIREHAIPVSVESIGKEPREPTESKRNPMIPKRRETGPGFGSLRY